MKRSGRLRPGKPLKRNTPIKTGKPLARSKPLRRKKPIGRGKRNGKRTREEQRFWRLRVDGAFHLAEGQCQLHGLHSVHCKGYVSRFDGQGHHVWPLEWGGDDATSEVLWVHEHCHQDLHHKHPAKGIELGYLTRGPDHEGD